MQAVDYSWIEGGGLGSSSTIHKARQGTFYTLPGSEMTLCLPVHKPVDLGRIQLVVMAGGDPRKAIKTYTDTFRYSKLSSVRACAPMTVIAKPAFESSKEARGSTSRHVDGRRAIHQ